MTVSTVVGVALDAHQSTEIIRVLLAASASRDGDLAAVVDRVGPARTARVLLDELLFRAGLDELAWSTRSAVTVGFRHAGTDYAATVTVGPDGVGLADPPAQLDTGLAWPAVVQAMTEVALALYGPVELVDAVSRTIRWPGPEVVFPTADRPRLPTEFYAAVQRVVQILDRQEPAELAGLAVRYGTDKWGAMHRYPQVYQRHFGPLRQHRLTLLEIGVGGFDDPAEGGRSLRMWKRFFPRALVYGVDILDKRQVSAPRMTTVIADQSRADELTAVAHRYGPFDLVIDDGSHRSSHVLTTFHTLFPHVRGAGLYVIEDLQAGYWPEHFAGNDADLNDPAYTVGFLKTLLDGLHHEELLRPDARAPQPTDREITGVHVYRNLAVIEKGPNTDGSPIATLLRAGRPG